MLKNNKIIHLIISIILVFTFVFTSCNTLFVSAETKTKEWKTAKELIKENGFLNGIQMIETEQGSTGNDIGDAGIWKTKADFKPEVWREFFANSKAMGFEICKIWNNYQMGGILFDDDWAVIGPSESYLENLETIFQMAQESDMYICMTLMTHFETAFGTNKRQYNYDRLIRLVHNEEYRNMFINNWVKPVLELSAKYPNVIMADLYCEPEADGGIWNTTRGTNWENMRDFISALNEAVEQYNPNLATYCSAGGIEAERIGELYSGLGLDYYGFDEYFSDSSEIENPYNLFLDRPLVFGEIGIEDIGNDDATLSNYYKIYLNKSVENGVKAAFYWSYNPSRYNSMSLIDDDDTTIGRLRPAALAMREWASEREKVLKNTPNALDKPAIMYSTGDFLRFFGARNATSLTVQRSEDKTGWTDLVSFNPNNSNSYQFADMMYEYNDTSLVEGTTYYYRIKATDGTNISYSDISYPITK